MRDQTNDQPNPHDIDPAGNQRALELIAGARQGDEASISELISLIYPELERRAHWLMSGERTGHPFGPSGSELVQRLMVRILESGAQIFNAVNTEEELIRLLTRRMRWILVDYAIHDPPDRLVPFHEVKRSALVSHVAMEEVPGTHQALADLEEALAKLAEEDAQAALAIELRAFSGLTSKEAAGAMGLSVASFRRSLSHGKAFLKELIESPARQAWAKNFKKLQAADPLASAFLRGIEAKRRLIGETGGVYSTEQVAEFLGTTPQEIDKRRTGRKLLGLVFRRKGYMYPVWQFDKDRGTLPGLEEVLLTLADHDAWMQNIFFVSRNTRLNERRPFDLLRQGEIEPVIEAAKSLGEHGAP